MADKYNLGDNIPNDSKKETNSLYKPKSFLKKIFIKYPYRLKYILWNCHFGKLLILLLIIFIIIILIWNNYNINGDYPELTDAEKKQLEDNGEDIDNVLRNYRFFTLLLNICLGLLSGILSIILGVESYKSLLEQRKKGIFISNLSTLKFIQRKFIAFKQSMFHKDKTIAFKQSMFHKDKTSSGIPGGKSESESEASEISIGIDSETTSELKDEIINKLKKIEDEIKTTDYIIEDEKKVKIFNNTLLEIATISNNVKTVIIDAIGKENIPEKKEQLESLITLFSTLKHSDTKLNIL